MATTDTATGRKHRSVEELIRDKEKVRDEVRFKFERRMARLEADLQQLYDIRDGRRKHRIRKATELSEADREALANFESMDEATRKATLRDLKRQFKLLKLTNAGESEEDNSEADIQSEEEETEVFEESEDDEDDDE